MRKVLHVGSGKDPLPDWLGDAEEVRLDIDPANDPHIVGDMRTLGDVGQFDVVYCSHALEHLYPHEVHGALVGFRRVLNDGGHAVIFVPDLEDVKPTEEVLMVTPAGPVAGIDMYYGFRPMLQVSPAMAHHTGFVRYTLERALERAGFQNVIVRRLPDFNLMGGGTK